jgi:hypothetical protein
MTLQVLRVAINLRKPNVRSSMIVPVGTSKVQIFGNELAFGKYCQKEWPSPKLDQIVADMVRNRGLN